jgi:hypothetical protein
LLFKDKGSFGGRAGSSCICTAVNEKLGDLLMKHIGRVSVIREGALRGLAGNGRGTDPCCADAKTDLMNAVWRAWADFVVAKKNETRA